MWHSISMAPHRLVCCQSLEFKYLLTPLISAALLTFITQSTNLGPPDLIRLDNIADICIFLAGILLTQVWTFYSGQSYRLTFCFSEKIYAMYNRNKIIMSILVILFLCNYTVIIVINYVAYVQPQSRESLFYFILPRPWTLVISASKVLLMEFISYRQLVAH